MMKRSLFLLPVLLGLVSARPEIAVQFFGSQEEIPSFEQVDFPRSRYGMCYDIEGELFVSAGQQFYMGCGRCTCDRYGFWCVSKCPPFTNPIIDGCLEVRESDDECCPTLECTRWSDDDAATTPPFQTDSTTGPADEESTSPSDQGGSDESRSTEYKEVTVPTSEEYTTGRDVSTTERRVSDSDGSSSDSDYYTDRVPTDTTTDRVPTGSTTAQSYDDSSTTGQSTEDSSTTGQGTGETRTAGEESSTGSSDGPTTIYRQSTDVSTTTEQSNGESTTTDQSNGESSSDGTNAPTTDESTTSAPTTASG